MQTMRSNTPGFPTLRLCETFSGSRGTLGSCTLAEVSDSPPNDERGDPLVDTLYHEIIETLTNPINGSDAWTDEGGSENGDKVRSLIAQ